MQLFRMYAYSVTPQRTAEEAVDPEGGAFTITADMRQAFDRLTATANLNQQSLVDFATDEDDDSGNRLHPVRELILSFSFGGGSEASAAAAKMARALGACMDKRSPPTLLMLAASRNDDNSARTTLWAFPKEEAFQFKKNKSGASVKLLSDIFSQSSKLRKAALFQGHNLRTHFWNGRVLDLQTTGSYGRAADYWIKDFLQCRLGLDGDAGTRVLADAVRKAFDLVSTDGEREQLYGAVVAVRTSPRRVWSAKQFARQYLQADVQGTFLNNVPSHLQALSFNFNRQVFEERLNFRVFRLDTGVYVSAPMTSIGQSVTVSEGEKRTLRCEGTVVEEHMRSRRA